MAVLIPAPAVLDTVAVKVIDCPVTDGFVEEITSVEVGPGLIIWLALPELPTKFPSLFV